jgi:hypothetical protein
MITDITIYLKLVVGKLEGDAFDDHSEYDLGQSDVDVDKILSELINDCWSDYAELWIEVLDQENIVAAFKKEKESWVVVSPISREG